MSGTTRGVICLSDRQEHGEDLAFFNNAAAQAAIVARKGSQKSSFPKLLRGARRFRPGCQEPEGLARRYQRLRVPRPARQYLFVCRANRRRAVFDGGGRPPASTEAAARMCRSANSTAHIYILVGRSRQKTAPCSADTLSTHASEGTPLLGDETASAGVYANGLEP